MRQRTPAGLALALGLSIALLGAPSGAAASQDAAKTKTKAKAKVKDDAKAKAKAKDEAKAEEEAKPPVDINSASAEELEALPEIGPVGAKKIIDGRPYKSVADLGKAGLSAKAIDAIKPLVTVGKPEAKKADAKKGAAAARAKAKADEPASSAKVDLNKADADELQTLPGIGPALAKAIIDGRPYKSVADLDRVKGLGPAKIAELKDRVAVGRPSAPAVADAPKAKLGGDAKKKDAAAKPAPGGKVNLNTATKEELDSLLNIGPVRAQAIIDARPFAKPEDVMKVKGIKEDTFGKIKDRITVK